VSRQNEKICREFGRRVRELRKEKGISQEALALASGLDRSYVGQVERGEKNISLVNIYRIAAGLAIHPAAVFPEVTSLPRGR
jgi:transcriptional regulator with XRE-family HTH domain